MTDSHPSSHSHQRKMKFRGSRKRSQVEFGSEESPIRGPFSVNRPLKSLLYLIKFSDKAVN